MSLRPALLSSCLLPLLLLSALPMACAHRPTSPPLTTQESPIVNPEATTAAARIFVNEHETRVAPLFKAMNHASWTATIQGTEQAFDEAGRLELELRKAFSSKDSFVMLRVWKESGHITDPILRRQIELLYNAFAANQMDPELMKRIVDQSTEVAQLFSTWRGKVGDKELTANDVADILRSSPDVVQRKAAWEASKGVGPLVSAKVIEVVKLRNEAARKMGYANYYDMQLRLAELDPDTVKRLFDDLTTQTDAPFKAMKSELDTLVAARFKITPAELRPWHYDDVFFQEAPRLTPVDFDVFYKGKDIPKITADYFTGIGLDVAPSVIAASDLFEKPGKQPAAYCNDMDRQGDVRIFANVRDDEGWMGTMLHEMGHAVYSRYHDSNADLPFTLRDSSASFTTEAIAELFGRLSMEPDWIAAVVGAPKAETDRVKAQARKTARARMLIFSRWSALMVNFERSLYENPDQDLNRLWWELEERLQMIPRPDQRNSPDWATKIHIVTYPVYYHNYIMGEMMASQVLASIAKEQGRTDSRPELVGRPDVGQWMIERIFKPGALYRWDELLVRATGETLNPRFFAEEWMKE